jgi:hypothetical protein
MILDAVTVWRDDALACQWIAGAEQIRVLMDDTVVIEQTLRSNAEVLLRAFELRAFFRSLRSSETAAFRGLAPVPGTGGSPRSAAAPLARAR